MSRPVINCRWQGRAGNSIFQAAFALAYGERHGCEVRFDPWWGFKIFVLDYNPIREELPRRNEVDLIDGETNVELRGYWQNKRSAIYSQEQIRRWFRFRPHVEAALQFYAPAPRTVVAHLRRGDYVGDHSAYPVISEASYEKCCASLGIDKRQLAYVREEDPRLHPDFTGELAFVPDFFVMTKAKTLLRANSSFSFWAGAIAESTYPGVRVFSPLIDGLKGGIEHDCTFIEGNHARIADFDFVSPIHIPA